MGKRIPKSRRHKKLKFVDPCYTGLTPRSKNRKKLPNEPPKEEDYQEVPRHMVELINVKNEIKTKKFKRKKKKTIKKDDFIIVKRDRIEDNQHGMSKPLKSMPDVVKQKKFESEKQFFTRLQNMADFAIAEAKIEQKYDIDLINIDEKGNAQFVSAPKEATEKLKQKRKKYNEKGNEKKKQKIEDQQFELKKEKIEFGDITYAPPLLTAKPRKAPQVDKAGTKSLVLKKLLNSGKPMSSDAEKPPTLGQKWKKMTPERRKVIEKERLRAVEMYRMLKNKKSAT